MRGLGSDNEGMPRRLDAGWTLADATAGLVAAADAGFTGGTGAGVPTEGAVERRACARAGVVSRAGG